MPGAHRRRHHGGDEPLTKAQVITIVQDFIKNDPRAGFRSQQVSRGRTGGPDRAARSPINPSRINQNTIGNNMRSGDNPRSRTRRTADGDSCGAWAWHRGTGGRHPAARC